MKYDHEVKNLEVFYKKSGNGGDKLSSMKCKIIQKTDDFTVVELANGIKETIMNWEIRSKKTKLIRIEG